MSAQRDLLPDNESGATDALPRCRRPAFSDYGTLTGPCGEFANVAEGRFGSRWGFRPDPKRPDWFIVVNLALRCSKCGALNVGELATVARPGGTHYRTRTREDEPGKTEGRHVRATSCGTWRHIP